MSYTEQQKIKDYRTVFGSDIGKRVFDDLAVEFHLLGGTLDADALMMAHKEGERNVLLHIMKLLRMTPSDVLERAPSMVEQFGLTETIEIERAT